VPPVDVRWHLRSLPLSCNVMCYKQRAPLRLVFSRIILLPLCTICQGLKLHIAHLLTLQPDAGPLN